MMSDWHVRRGDCYEVIPTLDSSSVDLVIADPPYGTTQIEWDDEHPPLGPLWDLLYEVGKEDCVFVFYSAQPFTTDLIESNRDDWRYEIIWRKTMGTNPWSTGYRPLQAHENLEVFSRSITDATYNPQMWESTPYLKTSKQRPSQYNQCSNPDRPRVSNGERHPHTVLTFRNGNNQDSPHPSAKPLGLMRWLVRTYTNEGDRVLAPFCGSGRAGVAAVKEARRFIGIEQDEEHAEGARKRIAATANSPDLFDA